MSVEAAKEGVALEVLTYIAAKQPVGATKTNNGAQVLQQGDYYDVYRVVRPRVQSVTDSMGAGSKLERSSTAYNSTLGGKSSDGGNIQRSRRRLSGRATRESCEDSSVSLHDKRHEAAQAHAPGKIQYPFRHRHLC
jgi:hypothetical protein